MAKAMQRNMVQAPVQVPQFNDLREATEYAQLMANALHELNARIFFLQEQLETLATATSTTIQTLEDY